jgi:hypothetical protein
MPRKTFPLFVAAVLHGVKFPENRFRWNYPNQDSWLAEMRMVEFHFFARVAMRRGIVPEYPPIPLAEKGNRRDAYV